MNKNQILTLSTLGGILIGVAMIGYGIYTIQKGMESKNWPVVTGEILSATLETFEKRTDNGVNVYHQPMVTYRYEVQGRAYIGDQLRISSPMVFTESELEDAEAYLKPYEVGTSVPVRYHPNNPEQSTLKTGYNPLLWLFIAGGVFFAAVTIGIYRSTKNSIYW